MELLIWLLEGTIESAITSIPLVTYFLCKKSFGLVPKTTGKILVLQLLISLGAWIKLKDLSLTIYQSVPYVSSFICIWCDHIMLRRKVSGELEENLGDE